MAEYNFVTTWHIAAPRERIWEIIIHFEDWHTWWSAVDRVVEIEPGEPGGLGNVRLFTWKTPLSYTLTFETRVTRIEPPAILEATATGEVEGVGLWELSPTAEGTSVRYTWTVRTTKPWMNWLAMAAKPLLEWNHNTIMRQGGEALAELLNARLIGIDLQ
jgi:uncharacterized protein YndB with AHSA1/START domain